MQSNYCKDSKPTQKLKVNQTQRYALINQIEISFPSNDEITM